MAGLAAVRRHRRHAELVAVRRGARGFGRADDAAAAGLVDHHHAAGPAPCPAARRSRGPRCRWCRPARKAPAARWACWDSPARQAGAGDAAPARRRRRVHSIDDVALKSSLDDRKAKARDANGWPRTPQLVDNPWNAAVILGPVNYAQLLFPDFSLIACGWLLCRYTALTAASGTRSRAWSTTSSSRCCCSIRSCAARSTSAPPRSLLTAGVGVGLSGIALAYALPFLPWLGAHIDRARPRGQRAGRLSLQLLHLPGAGRAAGRRRRAC